MNKTIAKEKREKRIISINRHTGRARKKTRARNYDNSVNKLCISTEASEKSFNFVEIMFHCAFKINILPVHLDRHDIDDNMNAIGGECSLDAYSFGNASILIFRRNCAIAECAGLNEPNV